LRFNVLERTTTFCLFLSRGYCTYKCNIYTCLSTELEGPSESCLAPTKNSCRLELSYLHDNNSVADKVPKLAIRMDNTHCKKCQLFLDEVEGYIEQREMGTLSRIEAITGVGTKHHQALTSLKKAADEDSQLCICLSGRLSTTWRTIGKSVKLQAYRVKITSLKHS
jgi:hypothetical protein